MNKKTLELLHSKLSDLDGKIAEISSLRQQIFDILKDHENKQDAAAAAIAMDAESQAETAVNEAKNEATDAEEQLNLSQIQTKVDEAVQEDESEDDIDDNDNIGDIDSAEDVEIEGEKAKEDIAREAISIEAHKLMESAPDDVEPMRDSEESLENDIQGEAQEGSAPLEMVNNPQTISTTDPTIIPPKVLDEDLDVGKDSDLVKVNDAFAEMDRIESQEDIEKMEEELSKEHDHSDLVASEEPKDEGAQEEINAENKVDAENKVEAETEPESDTDTEEVSEIEVNVEDDQNQEEEAGGYALKNPSEDTLYESSTKETEEDEPIFVQPRPIQHTPSQQTHPSNQGTLNASHHSTGMKVDEMLSRQNSRNIYKAFTLNDKFRFRRELFHGKDAEMADALDRISIMDNYSQAEDYFYETLGLNPNNEDVKEFMMIIKNHFA